LELFCCNVTDVRFEPVEPGFEPEPHLFEPLLAVRFRRVQIGSVSGSAPGLCGARVRTSVHTFEPVGVTLHLGLTVYTNKLSIDPRCIK
jgi:hypothetical protein